MEEKEVTIKLRLRMADQFLGSKELIVQVAIHLTCSVKRELKDLIEPDRGKQNRILKLTI